MLLSLIFADNPQAYSNDIVLFDRKRGTGESIWDIKDNIGFVSPEMHLYFNRHKTCREVALSGLSENPYRKIQVTDEIIQLADNLFDYFAITGIYDGLFQHVSTGQQNVILLIRALVKNPPMLVLDEPFQGIDFDSVNRAKCLLDEYCKDRTLIFVSHQPDELPSCVDKYFHIENKH
jgi:molybdate transport system ATP-binding protein